MFTMMFPSYLPNLIYFRQIYLSSELIYADHFRYSKNHHLNRYKLDSKNWLSVPLRHATFESISFLEIKTESNWVSKHLNSIKHKFHSYPYFEEIYPQFENIYVKNHKYFFNFIFDLNKVILEKLKFKIRIFKSSDFKEKKFEDIAINFAKDENKDKILINNFYLSHNLVNTDYLNKFMEYEIFEEKSDKFQETDILSFLFENGPEAPFIFGKFAH